MHTNDGSMFIEISKAKEELDRVLDWVAAIGPVVLLRNGQRIATISNYGESMQHVVGVYEKMQETMDCLMAKMAQAGEQAPNDAGRS